MHKRTLFLGSALVLLVGSVAAFAQASDRGGPRYEFNCGGDNGGNVDWFKPPYFVFSSAPPSRDDIFAMGKMCAAREVRRSDEDLGACGQCCHGSALKSVIESKKVNPNWILDFWQIKQACSKECELCINVKSVKPLARPRRNVLCLHPDCRSNIMGLYTCFPPPKTDAACKMNPYSLGGMQKPSQVVAPPVPAAPSRPAPVGGARPPKKTGIFGKLPDFGRCCLPPSITAVASAPPICAEKTAKCEELGRLPPAPGKQIVCIRGDDGDRACANIH